MKSVLLLSPDTHLSSSLKERMNSQGSRALADQSQDQTRAMDSQLGMLTITPPETIETKADKESVGECNKTDYSKIRLRSGESWDRPLVMQCSYYQLKMMTTCFCVDCDVVGG